MPEIVRKGKPEPQRAEPVAEKLDMTPIVLAINEQTTALMEIIAARLEQEPPPQATRWVFKIVRDGAGDLKEVIAERGQ